MNKEIAEVFKRLIHSVNAEDAPEGSSKISQRDVTLAFEHACEMAGFHLEHEGLLIAVEV